MKLMLRCSIYALFVCSLLLLSSAPAEAQFGPRADVMPGQVLAKEKVAGLGAAGDSLSKLVGNRPVLLVYWRPTDRASEYALIDAVKTTAEFGNAVAVLPVAVLASGQPRAQINTQLRSMGLGGLQAAVDRGELARVFGISKVPSFALLDASGTLRLVGGMTMSQQDSRSGVSIRQAVQRASAGQPVPNLGVLPAQPVHGMLGRKLPTLDVKKTDMKTSAKVSDYIEPGKKLLLFYWSPTCPHCKKALPTLKSWYAKRPKDVVVVDVAKADHASLTRVAPALVADLPWEHLMDHDGSTARKLRIKEFPTSVLVSESGEILSVQVGGDVDWQAWVGGS